MSAVVFGWFGWDGRGKTLSATTMCYIKHKMEGYQILHNGCLKFGEEVDFLRMINLDYKRAVILIDEAHTMMDSRRSMQLMNIEASNFVIQRRKLDVSMYYTTHQPGMVDPRIRMQTNLDFWCNIDLDEDCVWLTAIDTWGHFGPAGNMRQCILHGVSRFYALYDTAGTRPLGFNRVDKREMGEQKRGKEIEQVVGALRVLHANGTTLASAAEIGKVLAAQKVNITGPTSARILSSLGFQSAVRDGRRRYFIPDVLEEFDSPSSYRFDGERNVPVNTPKYEMDEFFESPDPVLGLTQGFDPAKLDQNSMLMDDVFAMIAPEGYPLKALAELAADAGWSDIQLQNECERRGFRIVKGTRGKAIVMR
jgi:hypothetical protein